ncbi:alpha/beta fold hydrolase [Thalassococcus sp. CAU 1522]|uniref:Alpha/beta fold hydrolase n=1 Tax=Thalassococcus arenae TaxID=2851652 RepID=A0ABS6N6C1_9RHOB|nr:alpha/beta hydrolase [Thalassococcus arenae]MBV2359070.1 alpha/beta fold hydrolase [Thalassococcus arenae]
MPDLTVGGTAIHVNTLGSGAARVLALHCGLGRSGMWSGVAAALADRATLIAPDFPSHGASAPWAPTPDLHSQATDVAAALLQEGIHLLGHSFGATVALRVALENPGRVASLTLVEPVLFAAADGAVRDAHRVQDEEFHAAFVAGDHAKSARLFNRLWGGGLKWDALPQQTRDAMTAGMPFIVATGPALWDDVHGMLAPGRLEALPTPVALLRGSETQPIIAAIHAGLVRRIRDARDIVVPGGDHMLVLGHPDAVARAVQAHLERRAA